MNAKELQDKLDVLNNQIAGMQKEAQALAVQLDVALAKERAAAKLAVMSSGERAALVEALKG